MMLKERDMPRPKPPEPMKRVTIILPESVIERLSRLAIDEGIPYTVLIRHWIMERLKRFPKGQ